MFFASRGCTILATDLDPGQSNPDWITTGQHAASLAAIHQPLLLDRARFEELVSFTPVDMCNLNGLQTDYDFLWSSCALEHLGSLEAGMDFIMKSAQLLRKDGIAVHTTEFNVTSNTGTVETGASVIYRQRDIQALAQRLNEMGCALVSPDFNVGSHRFDMEYDLPPYMQSDRRHIKLLLDGQVATSMLLIVKRWGMLDTAFKSVAPAHPSKLPVGKRWSRLASRLRQRVLGRIFR